MTSNRDQAPVPPHTLSVNTLTTGKRHTRTLLFPPVHQLS